MPGAFAPGIQSVKKPQTVKTRDKNAQEQKAFSLWEKV